MVRMIEEDTRFGVGSYKYLSDSIHSIEDAMQWLCRLRDVGPYKVEYIRLEDIDGNENDTTTRISADATAEEICDCIEGKEIGRVAVKATGADEKFSAVSTKVENVKGVHDLYLHFEQLDGTFNFDWWQFQ